MVLNISPGRWAKTTLSAVSKGLVGGGWRPTAPEIQQKSSPRIVFSYSHKRPGEASWRREAKIAARQFFCRAIAAQLPSPRRQFWKRKKMSSIVGERHFGRHFKRQLWARVIESQKLPRDSKESIFAARHQDVSQGPQGSHKRGHRKKGAEQGPESMVWEGFPSANLSVRHPFPVGQKRQIDFAGQKLPRDNFCLSLVSQLPPPLG